MVTPAPGVIFIEIINEKSTKQGIYLPESLSGSDMKAKVLTQGNEKIIDGKFISGPVKPGDIIYFKVNNFIPIPDMTDKRQGFIPFEAVLGIITEDKK